MISTTPSVPSIAGVERRIAQLREQLTTHRLYSAIRTIRHLRIFMESHVFAVWDFMSLLKCIQRSLTSVELYWTPTKLAASRRFVNEIVLAEESDDYQGRPLSHFEIYLESMQQVGANTSAIRHLIDVLGSSLQKESNAMDEALVLAPQPAQQFVRTTFSMIQERSLPAQAAAFTFGREDAIPDMFRSLVRELNYEVGGELAQFVWYLERHIEIDGDEHGPLSRHMVADLCGDNLESWEDAALAAEDALRARLRLWDGILAEVERDQSL